MSIEALTDRFPLAFSDPPKPLRIGAAYDLAATGVLPPDDLHAALTAWCSSRAYQAAIAAGGTRYALDGMPAGEVEDGAQRFAALMVAAIDAGEPDPRKAANAARKAATRARKALERADTEKVAPVGNAAQNLAAAAGKPHAKRPHRSHLRQTGGRGLDWRR